MVNIQIEKISSNQLLPQHAAHEPEVKLTTAEKSVLDYWNYLSGGANWHSKKSGLLHFIADIFTNARDGEVTDLQSQMGLDPVIVEFAVNIGENLDMMSAKMVKLQGEHPDLDFSNLLLAINSCRESLAKMEAPTPVVAAKAAQKGRAGRLAKLKMKWDTGEETVLKEKEEGSEISYILGQIRQYIIENRMSLEDAFDLFDADSDNFISEKEFTEVCQKVIGVTDINKIEEARKTLDKDVDGNIDFMEFANKLCQFYKKNPHKNDLIILSVVPDA